MFKILTFSHRYSKLDGIVTGDLVTCSHVKTNRMCDFDTQFLFEDTKPLSNTYTDLRTGIYDLFRSFGYKRFGDDTVMSAYFFYIQKDGKLYKFSTIRKPGKFVVNNKARVVIHE